MGTGGNSGNTIPPTGDSNTGLAWLALLLMAALGTGGLLAYRFRRETKKKVPLSPL
jgi:LPXTG-motif cell wall-anchored protein